MSTSAPISPPISPDEFQALEQKVLRAVEIVKREREARASAEAELARLQQQISALQGERAEVRQRVEKMLHQMDEFL